jgi:Ca-activated chloride channel family protein
MPVNPDPNLDLYAIMGISPDASHDEIRAVYRAAARRLHPDVNHHEGAGLQFRDIAAAHEILIDESARATYHHQRSKRNIHAQHFLSRNISSKGILPIIDEPHVLYLLTEITPAVKITEKKRTPMNIALILDRSASMSGQRLDRVKKAARDTVDKLSADDRITIVSFSDRSDILFKSTHVTPQENKNIKAAINMITASGATEIFHGLKDGFEQVKKHYNRKYVNHIILITDGYTYGDEPQSLELANEAKHTGVGISALGIGDEWNDNFLDDLASRTGGTATLIRTPSEIDAFLDELVKSLGDAYAERMTMTVAPDADISLEAAFRLSPGAQPLDFSSQPIQLGALTNARPMLILLQLQMPPSMQAGFRTVARLDISGDVMSDEGRVSYKIISDQTIEVMESPPVEDPPPLMLDALGKLTLYRMQQKAEEAVKHGRPDEATRKLQNLSTRLLEAGHSDLAQLALSEAHRISQTKVFSEEGRKTLKFGTRSLSSRTLLLLPTPPEDPNRRS